MNEHNPKIYLLPNLMTAGNLFCGFAATLKIVQGALIQWSSPDEAATLFHAAVWFILGACIFDVLDGRLARLGDRTALLAANSIPSPTLFRLVSPPR